MEIAQAGQADGALALARTRLREGVAAYVDGDAGLARDKVLSAYLDGVEPAEPLIGTRDTALLRELETAMASVRAAIGNGADAAEVQARAETAEALLDRAEATISDNASAGATTAFVGALVILLREGLEALLIVIAMMAFLRKAERTEAMPYVHGGWIGALVAGGATWLAATYLIDISGASRELTEGFAALFAAAVLVSVGIWMHGKSKAHAGQRHIRQKTGQRPPSGPMGFLRKAERTEAMPYVHGGWIGALVAGGATWLAATYLIDISGASRELTEGFAALFAAAVLVSVGIWMHGKSKADAWQRYIREKLSHALSRGSMWFLFLLAFVVVYREAFETVLFYAALWSQGHHGAILAGAAAAVAALAVIAWLMLRYSRRMPFGTFFAVSAVLVAVLAVVLAGKGVAALQEAGWVPMAMFDGPRIDLLGIHPTVQGISVQLAVLAVLVIGFIWNTRNARAAVAAR